LLFYIFGFGRGFMLNGEVKYYKKNIKFAMILNTAFLFLLQD